MDALTTVREQEAQNRAWLSAQVEAIKRGRSGADDDA